MPKHYFVPARFEPVKPGEILKIDGNFQTLRFLADEIALNHARLKATDARAAIGDDPMWDADGERTHKTGWRKALKAGWRIVRIDGELPR